MKQSLPQLALCFLALLVGPSTGGEAKVTGLVLDSGAATTPPASRPIIEFIGCRLGNTRSRGIIVKSDNGLIKDNIITRCGLAVRIGPEWPDEADYCHTVTVTGNTISDNGEGIVVDGSGAKENRSITITNNRLKANTGGDIRIAWADGVTITGNIITAPASLPPGARPKPPIETRDSQNVHNSGNQIKTASAYSAALLYALVDWICLDANIKH